MTCFKRTATTILTGLLLVAGRSPAAAQKAIKFATLIPEGSTWMKVMAELDKELQEKTGGKVKFKMYAGGVVGDEKDVVKKIRINQFHAAGFTGIGLGEIAPEVRILDSPWLFRGNAELDHVYKAFDGEFRAALDKGGYELLGWTELGPVHVFSKTPIEKPEDMKKCKMWVWEGDPIAQSAYKAIGVNPIPLPVVDVMSQLQTGMIDAVYGPPSVVLTMQWFTKTKFVYSVPMAQAAGAVVVSKKFLEGLAPEDRAALKEISAKHLGRLNGLIRKENDAALATLKAQGLSMTGASTPEIIAKYRELGVFARKELAGKLYTPELLARVEKSLEEFRKKAPEGKNPKSK